MKKCLKLKEVNSITDVDQIDSNEIDYLWYSDWWDGPVEGVLKYQDQKHWFQVVAESKNPTVDGFFRRYLVIELSPEQIKEEEYWHTLFVEKVGGHHTTDINGVRNTTPLKPRESWKEFYDAYQQRTSIDMAENRVVGFYEVR